MSLKCSNTLHSLVFGCTHCNRSRRADTSRGVLAPAMCPADAATSATATGVFAPFDRSEPRTAAAEADGDAADVAAPMHGRIATGHHPVETARRLVMTAPPPSCRTGDLGKRSRGGNRTPISAPGRNRTGLAKGRAAFGNDHSNGSIPFKSRRISGPDVEPVVHSQLSLRRREAAAGLPVPCDDFSGGFLTQGTGGGQVERGTQAVCGRPLVPRPSSPRAQAECHPW